jgi:hypothetical protein
LRPEVEGLSKAWDEYIKTIAGIGKMASNATDAMTAAAEKLVFEQAKEQSEINKLGMEIQGKFKMGEAPAMSAPVPPAASGHALDVIGKQLAAMHGSAETVSRDFSSMFVSAISGSESFGRSLKRLAMQLAEAIIQAQIYKALTGGKDEEGKDVAGGAIGGGTGFLGKMFGFMSKFGGFFAGGGPVASYTPYVVGEKGPELFVPDSAGSIIPNGAGGGGKGGDINIDARGADASVERRVMAAMQAYYKQSAVNGYLTTLEMSRRS